MNIFRHAQPTACGWQPPPERLGLRPGAVHVWRIAAGTQLHPLAYLESLLAPEERARAARFPRFVDRERWVIGRAGLRILLGRYLDANPADLRFDYGPFGKPALAAACNRPGLCFNLSHSGDWILCAVTVGQLVGVDVEQIRPELDAMGLARRWFAESEYRGLEGLPPPLRLPAFFAVWTRKEAYLKARGEGLASGLDRFEVSVHPEKPAALLAQVADRQAVSRWRLYDLDVDPEHAAALAVEGAGCLEGLWQEDLRLS